MVASGNFGGEGRRRPYTGRARLHCLTAITYAYLHPGGAGSSKRAAARLTSTRSERLGGSCPGGEVMPPIAVCTDHSL